MTYKSHKSIFFQKPKEDIKYIECLIFHIRGSDLNLWKCGIDLNT